MTLIGRGGGTHMTGRSMVHLTRSYDPQVLAIKEDGMRTPIMHARRTGGLPLWGRFVPH